MKRVLLCLLFLSGLFWGSPPRLQAQFTDPLDTTGSYFNMPIGYLQIGDQSFVGLRFNPEFRFWKMGIGIDIPLFFSVDDGSFRSEEYRNNSGFLRLIRYFRFGIKEKDKVYFRLGQLDRNYLGYGMLVRNYSNVASYERRKVGFEYDVRFLKIFGIEGAYSDISGGKNLVSVRPYVRPFSQKKIPIIKTLELGLGFVRDRDPNAFNGSGDQTNSEFVRSGLRAWSADLGLEVLKSKLLTLSTYVQYGYIGKVDALADSVDRLREAVAGADSLLSPALADGYHGGGGFSIGVVGKLKLIANVLDLDINLERLWQNEHYQPQFFDLVYEINKDEKLWSLANTERVSSTLGVLTATILKKISLTGGLRVPDRISPETPAFVQLRARLLEIIPKLTLEAAYLKGEIGNFADAFKLDERAQLNARATYRLLPHLLAGIDYRWTFALDEEGNRNRYTATSYVMPFVSLNFPIGGNP